MSSEREVTIYGQVYRVKGDDPERIARVAGYIDRMMTDVLGGPGQGLNARGAVLTALNVADEWFVRGEEWDKAIGDLTERVDELLGILPK